MAINLMIVPGLRSRDALMKEMGSGLYVVNTANRGGIDLASGTYAVGASGLWIEGGEPAYPVAGVTVTGDLRDMLRRVSMVGDDLRWYHAPDGSFGAPSLLVDGMTVVG